MEIKNALITKVTITSEDHGFLSAWIFLDYGGSGQGFGGYALYLPENFKHHKREAGYCGYFIWRVMEIAGVEKWENLKGKTIRVKGDHAHIEAIGHILKDNWFNPKEEFEKMEKMEQGRMG